MAGKNNEAGLFCNRISPLQNLSQQGYANFLRNQGLSKTASPRILGSRVNQTDVLHTNNIFIPPSTQVNLEEAQPEQDFHQAVENEFIQENFAFVRALKQQQKQTQQMLPQQQAFCIHEITSVQ